MRPLNGRQTSMIRRASQREIEQYRDINQEQRSQWALLTLGNLMKLASAVAEHRGLTFDPEDIRAEARVAKLSVGWWASDFALLDAVQSALERKHEEIATVLRAGNAFRDPPHDGVGCGDA